MWSDRSILPFGGLLRPADTHTLIGIAWLRASAAKEAYGFGDLAGSQHHLKMGQIAAAAALAQHRGMDFLDINDVFTASRYCRDELGDAVEFLFTAMARMTEVGLSEDAEVLDDAQHDAIATGLSSLVGLTKMVEGIIDL